MFQVNETQFDGYLPLNECAGILIPSSESEVKMESNGNRSRKPTNDFEQFPEPSIKSIEVHLQRNPTTGLGFNIVGGSDLPHIPGNI